MPDGNPQPGQVSGVVGPDGDLFGVPSEQLPNLLRSGDYRLAKPEELHNYWLQKDYGGFGQQAATFGERALSAFTFGLSPAIEVGLGITTPESYEARGEANPLTRMGGTGAGIVGSLAAGVGAPSAIGRAGGAAAAATRAVGLPGLLGRLAPAVATGATEAGLYSAADVTERALLGDPNLTWEKAATEVALGGLFGSALGAGAKGLSEVLPANLGQSASDFLGKTAAERNWAAVGLKPGGYKKLVRDYGEEYVQKMGEELGERGIASPLVTPEKAAVRARQLIDRGAAGARSLVDEYDASVGKTFSWDEIRTQFTPDLLKKLNSKAATMGAAKQFEGYLDNLSSAWGNKQLKLSDLWTLRQDLDDLVGYGVKNLDPAIRPVAEPLRALRNNVQGTIESELESSMGGGAGWREAMRQMEVGFHAESIAADAMLPEALRNPLGLRMLVGGGLGHMLGGPPGMLAGALAEKLWSKYGAGATGWLAGALKGLIDREAPISTARFVSQGLARPLVASGGPGAMAARSMGSDFDQFAASSSATQKLRDLYTRVAAPDGGFTFDVKTGAEPASGFVVSPHPERSVAIAAHQLKYEDLLDYVSQHQDVLFKEEGANLGAWHDPATNQVFLDVSKVVDDAQKAEALALRHDQIAYFDLKAGKSVTVDPAAKSGGAVLPEHLYPAEQAIGIHLRKQLSAAGEGGEVSPKSLIDALRDTVEAQGPTLQQIAAKIAPAPPKGAAVTAAPHYARYSRLVYEDKNVSAYLLGWPEGNPGTEIHGHGGSHAAVYIASGGVKETVYDAAGHATVRELPAGKLVPIPKKYIHKFEDAEGPGAGLSLHLYSPPLKKMEFYGYDKAGRFHQSGGWTSEGGFVSAQPSVTVGGHGEATTKTASGIQGPPGYARGGFAALDGNVQGADGQGADPGASAAGLGQTSQIAVSPATLERLIGALYVGSQGHQVAPTGAHLKILHLAKKAEKKLADASKAIFKGAEPEHFLEGGLVTPEEYPDVAANLRHFGSSLNALSTQVSKETGGLQQHAPALAQAAHDFAARVVGYLGSKLPQGDVSYPLDPPFEPSESELDEYNHSHEVAVHGPARVLEHVSRGTLNEDHLAASQAIYPTLHAYAQKLVMNQFAEHLAKEEEVPMGVRENLGLFLGVDLEHAQTGDAILAAQSTFHGPTANQPTQPPSKARAVKTEFAERAGTVSQRASMHLAAS